MMRILRRLVPGSLLVTGAMAMAAEGPDIGFQTVADALAALSADPELEFREESGWLSADRREGNDVVFWTFTSEEHEAHPAVIKRILIKTEGEWQLEMRVLCEADESACADLVGEFQAFNDRLHKRLSRPANKEPQNPDSG